MFGQTAPMIQTLNNGAIADNQLLAAGVFLVTLILLIPLVAIICTTWSGVIKLRHKAGLKHEMIKLKQQMIERGMSADEIVRVVGLPSESLDDLSDQCEDDAARFKESCSGEVVVKCDGQWQSALILGRSGDRYLIHTCPGYDGVQIDGNAWVGADQVRFPASSRDQEGSPRGSAHGAEAFEASHWSRQPAKEPATAEV